MQILKPETLFVGQQSLYLEQLTSTNDFLKDLVKTESMMEGFMLMAGEQTLGKGQNGKKWFSEPNENLLASFLFNPNFLSSENLHYLVFATALGVRATVQKFLPKFEIKVKWPNDIYVGDLKIAGILIENISVQKKISSITGVGINVNQSNFNNADYAATSISKLNNDLITPISEICQLLCTWLEKYYMTLRSPNGMKQIHQLYVSQLYKLNDTIYVGENQKPYEVLGVNPQGRLLVSSEKEILELAHNERKISWNSL